MSTSGSSSVSETVTQLFAKTARVPESEINGDTVFSSLGMDDECAEDLQLMIERALNLSIPNLGITEDMSLQQMVAYVEGLLQPVSADSASPANTASTSPCV